MILEGCVTVQYDKIVKAIFMVIFGKSPKLKFIKIAIGLKSSMQDQTELTIVPPKKY